MWLNWWSQVSLIKLTDHVAYGGSRAQFDVLFLSTCLYLRYHTFLLNNHQWHINEASPIFNTSKDLIELTDQINWRHRRMNMTTSIVNCVAQIWVRMLETG